jgi:DNA-binding HxlR family transcriptional regulator
MTIRAFAELNCSLARSLSFLGERWALLVLRDVSMGHRRFDQLQESLGVASNVLSQRLATLVEEGILERHRYSERPERFEYRLTPKGVDLIPVLLAFLRWGDRYTAGPEGAPMETVHEDCGEVFQMVPTCSECGAELDPRHMHVRPGPGATEKQRREAVERLRRAEQGSRRAAEPRTA